MDGQELETISKFKYLGLTWTSKMSLKPTVDDCIEKVERGLVKLRRGEERKKNIHASDEKVLLCLRFSSPGVDFSLLSSTANVTTRSTRKEIQSGDKDDLQMPVRIGDRYLHSHRRETTGELCEEIHKGKMRENVQVRHGKITLS